MQIFDQNLAYSTSLSEETSSLEVVSNHSFTDEPNLELASGCAGTLGTLGSAGGSFGTFGSYGCYGGDSSLS
jgi:hypothetical protein